MLISKLHAESNLEKQVMEPSGPVENLLLVLLKLQLFLSPQ